MVANALAGPFPNLLAIVEKSSSRFEILTRRRRRFGLGTVIGQAAFAPLGRFLRHVSRRRFEEIIGSRNFDVRPGRVAITHVASINGPAAIEVLHGIDPGVVAVAGTRLIGAKVLNSIGAPFLNLHAGITPAYRGNDTGYWALATGRPDCFGVTIHLVDRGLDTGPIVYQKRVVPDREDTIATYPCLLVAEGIPLLVRALEDALAGRLATRPASGASRLWTKPTMIQYVRNIVRHGVW
jgi:methionyl-tRNA formyltransferase